MALLNLNQTTSCD